MPIAKSTEPIASPKPFEKVAQSSTSSTIPTVGWDILRFFNIDMSELNRGNTQENLKEIEKWAFDGEETLGNGLMKLKNLEISLGTPQHGETRHSRIYNWVKMEKHIQDLKLRQRAL